MIDIEAYQLMHPEMVAKILRRHVRRLRSLAQTDPTFPRPFPVGRKHMFKEHEFIEWYGQNCKNRLWIFDDDEQD
jgi:predicted DNA-binding transcriptional regulator AlpA